MICLFRPRAPISLLPKLLTLCFASILLTGCGKSNVPSISFDGQYSALREGLHSGMTQQQVDESLKARFKDKVARFSDIRVGKLDGSGSDMNPQPISIDDLRFDPGWPTRMDLELFFTGTSADSAHKFNVSTGDKVDIVGTISNIEVFSLDGDSLTVYVYINDGEYTADTK
jgi:hypothetical protein